MKLSQLQPTCGFIKDEMAQAGTPRLFSTSLIVPATLNLAAGLVAGYLAVLSKWLWNSAPYLFPSLTVPATSKSAFAQPSPPANNTRPQSIFCPSVSFVFAEICIVNDILFESCSAEQLEAIVGT